jgi:putative SOS response-associated peptidase YedK
MPPLLDDQKPSRDPGSHARHGRQDRYMPPLPGIFPDYAAPIVRNSAEGRELVMARWGMPSPAFALQGKKSDPGVTNIRNTRSPHWRRWLGVESRCVVPFTSLGSVEDTCKNPRKLTPRSDERVRKDLPF